VSDSSEPSGIGASPITVWLEVSSPPEPTTQSFEPADFPETAKEPAIGGALRRPLRRSSSGRKIPCATCRTTTKRLLRLSFGLCGDHFWPEGDSGRFVSGPRNIVSPMQIDLGQTVRRTAVRVSPLRRGAPSPRPRSPEPPVGVAQHGTCPGDATPPRGLSASPRSPWQLPRERLSLDVGVGAPNRKCSESSASGHPVAPTDLLEPTQSPRPVPLPTSSVVSGTKASALG
jgi:hypothetical protein